AASARNESELRTRQARSGCSPTPMPEIVAWDATPMSTLGLAARRRDNSDRIAAHVEPPQDRDTRVARIPGPDASATRRPDQCTPGRPADLLRQPGAQRAGDSAVLAGYPGSDR